MSEPLIYLDHAAATPVDDAVLAAMMPFYNQQFYNPSATYQAARSAHAELEKARVQVAHWLGCRPGEISFTAGGTEANNIAIHGIMQRYPDTNIVISSIEHEAVLAPARNYNCREVVVDQDGLLDLTDLQTKIDDQTALVSIMQANNEIGTIQPLREIASLLHNIRRDRQQRGIDLPIYFHTDACQAANYLDMQVSRLGVDMLTLNAGKMYGPKQSGALFIRGGISLQPIISGGGQEYGVRAGTESLANSIGLATALDQAQTMRKDEAARLQVLQQLFYKLVAQKLPQAVINGSTKKRLPNNVHLTLPGYDNERLLIQLDQQGIMAAAGSACSASNEEPSHVLRAIGLDDIEAQASLRFTFGRSTTAAMIERVVEVLTGLVAAA